MSSKANKDSKWQNANNGNTNNIEMIHSIRIENETNHNTKHYLEENSPLHISDEIKSEELRNSASSLTVHKINNKLNGSLSTTAPTTTCDEKKEFTQRKKYIVFAVAAVSQILNQAGLSGLLPALPVIQDELNTTATITNVTVAMQSLMIGLLSAIWASYADGYGRRKVFIASNIFLVLGNIGSALSISIEMLLGFRLTSAIGAAASNALGAGMINDVFQDFERGKAMSWYGCMSLYCMVSSPFIGGVLTQYLGWRSIFWAFVIGYSILWLIIVLILPETNLHPFQSKQECHYDFEATDGVNDSTMKDNIKTQATFWKNNMINPFSSLMLLKFPNMLLCCSYLGLLGFTNNASAISFTWAYSIQYQFSPTLVGLFYLIGIIGNTAGTWLSGSMSDRTYIRRTSNAKMDDKPIYPEMRLSLKWQLVGGFFLAGGFSTYGWSTEKNVHFSAGIICLVFIQFGFSIANSFITVYAVQSFPKHGSSAQACIQTIRCILMGVGRFTVIELQDLLGAGLVFTILGGVLLVSCPFIAYIQRNREKWKERRELKGW